MRRAWAFGLTAVVVAACGGSAGRVEHPRTYLQAASFCEAECSRKHECNAKVDEARCRSKCEGISKEYVASLRHDHLETVESCVSSAPCEEIADNAFEPVVVPKQRCLLGLEPKLTPLGAKTAAALKARASKCGDSGFGASEALFGGLTDAILTDLQTCLDDDRSCRNFLACTKSVSGLP